MLSKKIWIYEKDDIKVPQKRVYLEINKMKRGKPHKRETQILVEELPNAKRSTRKTSKDVDKWLPLHKWSTEHGLFVLLI